MSGAVKLGSQRPGRSALFSWRMRVRTSLTLEEAATACDRFPKAFLLNSVAGLPVVSSLGMHPGIAKKELVWKKTEGGQECV